MSIIDVLSQRFFICCSTKIISSNNTKNTVADLSWDLKHNILPYRNLSPPSGTTGCSGDCLPLTNEVRTSISTHISRYKEPRPWLQPPSAFRRVAFSNVFLSLSVTSTTMNPVTYETGLQALWPPLPLELAVKKKNKNRKAQMIPCYNHRVASLTNYP